MDEVEVKGPNEVISFKDYYKLIAQKFPAYYPRWLSNKQAYWTIVGLSGDKKKVLLCEDGTIEPHKRGFTIMPFLYVDDRLITRDDAEISQSLEKEYLPIPSVKWRYKGLELNLKMFAYGKVGESSAYAWYTIKNNRRKKTSGKLFLTIRPFQVYPPWQRNTDGFAPIYSIKYRDSIIEINKKHKIYPLTKPDAFKAKVISLKFPFGIFSQPKSKIKEEIVAEITDNMTAQANNVESLEGFASAVIEYDFKLEADASQDIFLAIPLYNRKPDLDIKMGTAKLKKAFNRMLSERIDFWDSKVNKLEIDIPEVEIVNTLKSNIAYNLLTKDGPVIQPGCRSYDKGWMRDGGIQGVTFLKVGLAKDLRDFINWVTGFQLKTGEIPPVIDNKAKDALWEEKEQGLKEYDSQGEFVWSILQYYYFTKDKKFLEDKLPNVIKALEYLVHLRNQTLTPEFKNGPQDKKPFYGILPPSRSHEGYELAYSYWDDFWALCGWKAGETIAQILKRDDLAQWAKREYRALKKSVYNSINKTMKLKKINYIPGAADLGDFDPTSTAGAVIYCSELENLPQSQLKNTFDRYYRKLISRFKPDAKYWFTPYEVRNICAFVYMNQKERALRLLRFILKHRRPIGWNHLAEAVHSDYRSPNYIGDMPHTWVGAEYINAIRSLFVYEWKDRLILGQGIDRNWLSRKEGVSVKNIPTYYGRINYTLRKDKDALRVKIYGAKDMTSPPNGFIFKSPFKFKIKKVYLNEKRWSRFLDDEVSFDRLPANIVICYKSNAPTSHP